MGAADSILQPSVSDFRDAMGHGRGLRLSAGPGRPWAGPTASSHPLQAIVTDRPGGSAPGQPVLQGTSAPAGRTLLGALGAASSEQHAASPPGHTRCHPARCPWRDGRLLFVHASLVPRPCAAPPRPICRRAAGCGAGAGNGNTSCTCTWQRRVSIASGASSSSSTAAQRGDQQPAAQQQPSARGLHARRRTTAVPAPAAGVFHAPERQAANARLIRFSAAKSPDGRPTSAASAPRAARCFALAGRGPAQGLPVFCAADCDIALHAGAQVAVRQGLQDCRVWAIIHGSPASLVDRSRSPSRPHKSADVTFTTRDCKVHEQYIEAMALQRDAVGRQQAKRPVGAFFLHVSLAPALALLSSSQPQRSDRPATSASTHDISPDTVCESTVSTLAVSRLIVPAFTTSAAHCRAHRSLLTCLEL
ncbi:hypothetical protein SVAN01_08769 [Stagonosporopsis vannaccii]|nr:hypothetical protein SVAN01_08769 [Stagonosporopsis vannaccii]